MFAVVITEKGGAQRRMDFDKSEVTIGRVQGNDIILPKGNVSKRHSRIVLKDNRFIVVDLKSTNGTYVNGRKITSPLVVKPGDKIYIGDFILTVEDQAGAGAEQEPEAEAQPQAPEPQQPQAEAAAPPPPPPSGEQPASSPPPLRSDAPPSSGAGAPAQAQPAQPQSAQAQSARASAPPPLPNQGGGGNSAMQTQGQPAQAAAEPPPPPQESAPERFPLDEEPAEEAGPATPPPPPQQSQPQPQAAPQPRQPQTPHAQGQPAQAQGRSPEAGTTSSPPAPPATPGQGQATGEADARRSSGPAPKAPSPAQAQAPAAAAAPPSGLEQALRELMGRLSGHFDIHNADPYAMHDRERWDEAHGVIGSTISTLQSEGTIEKNLDTEQLSGLALREAVGLGALEPLLSDESVREVVVEGPRSVMADYGQGFQNVGTLFSSSAALYTAARRLLGQAGVQLDTGEPVQQATLPYGPHATVVLPPVAVRGPVIEVRRVGHTPSMQELTTRGVLNEEMADVLRRAVQARRNVAVVGPLGTGITTLLGALASFSEANERIVTAEDVADLGIQHEHVVSLASGGAHSGVSLRQVMHQAQRLRADRLVIDDVRDESALDALTVLASRGGGGLVGVHAAAGNQPLDALRGLACLGASSPQSVESLLARGVHVIVQVGHADGGRRITRIAEVVQDGRGCETRELFGYNGGFTTGSQASF